MSYACIHYHFENIELFEQNFSRHFVAEGIDQSRGWFYTSMVLSTALFGKPAFRNLICNEIVHYENGKKVSKSLRNYPSPSQVINNYGAVRSSQCPYLNLYSSCFVAFELVFEISFLLRMLYVYTLSNP
ncbi:hypothetical protein REPUB_Repub12eG0032100 [Reevesia pubescens]